MKKAIAFCLLMLLPVIGNSQVNKKPNYGEIDQDQLNLALAQSLKTIKTAKILTGIGAGLGIIGGVLVGVGINKSNNSTAILGGLPSTETGVGALMLTGGIITEAIAIPLWISRSKRKTNIEFELAKHKTSGLAFINGFGIKIRF